MIRITCLLAYFVLFFSVTTEAASPLNKSRTPNNRVSSEDLYKVNMPSRNLPDGSHLQASTINIRKVDAGSYLPATIHIKTKSIHTWSKDDKVLHSSVVMSSLSKLGVSSLRAAFPTPKKSDAMLSSTIGLDRIYEVSYTNGENPYEVCRELMNNPEIEYASPVFVRHTFETTTNDPSVGTQWAINNMQLPKAWDITKGSKDVIIAIVDSGTDWDHEDLIDNIWINPGETPDNGVDDDGNGKVDDIHGWDMVGNLNSAALQQGAWKEDNDPTNIKGSHGTHVAGLASAVTNNGKGISGTGFNCSILPVKCGSDQSALGVYRGYDGIKYAADMGADVINCSWGGDGSSPVEQDVINYAYAKGSLVVVASGNSGLDIDDGVQYPAAYNNVLCVGATASTDQMASFSNYGMITTVYAPGQAVFSTLPNNSYGNQNGTSMSSPIVAGLAGLVKSIHPDWTPRQIMHQIRSTCDNVLTTDENVRPYIYGRVNAYKAVDYNHTPGKTIPGIEITGFNIAGGAALNSYNETEITVTAQNFLGDANNLEIKFTPIDNFISVINTSVNAGTLANNETGNYNINVKLLPNNPWFEGTAKILVTFKNGEYTDYQLLRIPVRIQSKNSYSQYEFFASSATNWHTVSTPKPETVWAVFESDFTYGGSFMRIHNGNPDINTITQEVLYCIHGIDENIAFAGTGSQTNGSAYVFSTANGGSTWGNKEVTNITSFINDIHFFDNGNGLLLGDPRSTEWGVAYTTDGGVNWIKTSNIPAPLSGETGLVGSTYYLDDNVWFGTTAGRVFYSSDRGKNWTAGMITGAKNIEGVAFKDQNNGIAIYRENTQNSSPALLASTGNGGKTWTSSRYNFTQNGIYPVSGFTAPGSNTTFLLCSDGRIISTTDNGTTWETALTKEHGLTLEGADVNYQPGKIRLWNLGRYIGFLDMNYESKDAVKELTMVSGSSIDFDTVDVGKSKIGTIELKNTGNVTLNLSDVEIVASDSTEFRFFGSYEKSIEPGQTISIKISFRPKNEGIRTAQFKFRTEASNDPVSILLTGSGRRIVSVGETGRDIAITSLEIKPNPVIGEAVVNFIMAERQKIRISLVGSKGEELAKIFDGYAEIGTNTATFSASDLSSGVYFIRMESVSGTITEKFVVTR